MNFEQKLNARYWAYRVLISGLSAAGSALGVNSGGMMLQSYKAKAKLKKAKEKALHLYSITGDEKKALALFNELGK